MQMLQIQYSESFCAAFVSRGNDFWAYLAPKAPQVYEPVYTLWASIYSMSQYTLTFPPFRTRYNDLLFVAGHVMWHSVECWRHRFWQTLVLWTDIDGTWPKMCWTRDTVAKNKETASYQAIADTHSTLADHSGQVCSQTTLTLHLH